MGDPGLATSLLASVPSSVTHQDWPPPPDPENASNGAWVFPLSPCGDYWNRSAAGMLEIEPRKALDSWWPFSANGPLKGRRGQRQEADGVTFALQTVLGPGEVLPTAFEASEKWPNLIHGPLDQGNCAGSWAFSTAGTSKGGGWGSRKGGPRPEPPDGPSASSPPPPAVASDRVSIHSLGHMAPVLSPQNLLSCNTHNQQGCRGGRLDGAWWFLRRRG